MRTIPSRRSLYLEHRFLFFAVFDAETFHPAPTGGNGQESTEGKKQLNKKETTETPETSKRDDSAERPSAEDREKAETEKRERKEAEREADEDDRVALTEMATSIGIVDPDITSAVATSESESTSVATGGTNVAEGGRSTNNIQVTIGDPKRTPEEAPRMSEGEDLALLREKSQAFSRNLLAKFGPRINTLNIPDRGVAAVEQFKQDQAAQINEALRIAGSQLRVAPGPAGTAMLTTYRVKTEMAPPFESLTQKQVDRVVYLLRTANTPRMLKLPNSMRVQELNHELDVSKITTLHFADPLPGFTDVRILDGRAPSFS